MQPKQLFSRVHRQLKSVKACVRPWKWIGLTEWHRLNKELSIVAAITFKFSVSNKKVLKAINWNASASSAEVEHVAEFLLAHISHYLPKPFDDLMVRVVGSLVFRIFYPVFHIDERQSIKNHLQFICIKNGQQISRYYFIEGIFYGTNVVSYALKAIILHADLSV
jgi:hypothetical protein